MNSCTHRGGTTAKKILGEIVTDYITERRISAEKGLKYYAVQRSLNAAIEKAAMAQLPSGRRHPHQRRIPHQALSAAVKALKRIDLSIAGDFRELHAWVKEAIGPIKGIGQLTVYDTTHRIGAFLGLSPEHVYLHAGTRTGAKALGLDHRATKLPMAQMPKEMQHLRPYEVEDVLCIYKDDLKKLRTTGSS